jgi:hypothetical protein
MEKKDKWRNIQDLSLGASYIGICKMVSGPGQGPKFCYWPEPGQGLKFYFYRNRDHFVMLVPVFFLSKSKLHSDSDSDIYYLFYDQISKEAARFFDNLDKISSLIQFLILRSTVEALQQLIYFFHYMMNSKYS